VKGVSAHLGRLARLLPGLDEGASNARAGATKVERGAQKARHKRSFQWFARAGLIARAIVYVILGVLILEIAIKGRAPAHADTTGSFAEIARQPAGSGVLALLAVGLAAYALWRFVEAASRTPQGQPTSGWSRIGWVAAGIVYVALCLNVVKLMTGARPNGGPEEHPSSFAGGVLRLPLGPELLGLTAAASVAGGVCLIVWGVRHDYAKAWQTRKMTPRLIELGRWSGVAGNSARVVAVLLVATSLLVSAVSNDPDRAKSLDGALQALAARPVGVMVLVLVGAGFLSFGMHSLVEARFRQV
jgi:hypothetical protein